MSDQVVNAIDGSVTGTAAQFGVVKGNVIITTQSVRAGALWGMTIAVALSAFMSVVVAVWVVAGNGSGGWLLGTGLVVLLIVTAGAVWSVRAARTSSSLEDRVATLRDKVIRQWKDEAVARGLEQPRPLRLRWRPTARRAQISSLPESAPLLGALVQDTGDELPVAHQLASAFLDGPHRQLVVLGEPGAGKTTLAVLFTLAAASHDLLPVLLPVAGWQPPDPSSGTGEHIEHWIARRVAAAYGALAEGVPVARLLPVLDGLDEMALKSLGAALTDLDRAAGMGLRMVLTCRGEKFEKAVAGRRALTRAVVVDIEPVRPEDVAVYLTQSEVEGFCPDRWQAVTESLTSDPEGPVAAALSTPLMISLARRVYEPPRTDPGELIRLGTKQQIEHHLLDQFLVTAYPRDRDRVHAQHWLAFLAAHLRDRVGGAELEWWRIARAVPAVTIAVLVTAVITLMGALLTTALGAVLGGSANLAQSALLGSVVGLSVGVVAGLNAAGVAHAPSRPERRHVTVTAAGGVAWDLAVILSIACGVAAVLLLGMYVVARPAAFEMVTGVRERARDVLAGHYNAAYVSVLLIAVIVVGVAIVTNGVAAGRDGTPYRSSPDVRRLFLSLPLGLSTGLVVGTPWLVLVPATTLGVNGGLGLWLLTAALVGVPLAIGRWLAAPAPWRTAPSPLSVLRSDRTATLLTAVAAGGCGGMATAAALASATVASEDWIPAAVIVGIVITTVVFFGTGTAWSVYTVARIWLALRGHLPWRLMRFLSDAHAGGVLRSTGPAYQLRHDLLRGYLADQWRGSHVNGPQRRRVPRPHPAITAVAALSLLAAVATLVEVRNPLRRIFDTNMADNVTEVVFSGDGRWVAGITQGSSRVTAWNIESGTTTGSFLRFPGIVNDIGIGHDGTTCTTYGRNWLTRHRCTNDQGGSFAPEGLEHFSTAALSPDGATLAVAGRIGIISLVDTATMRRRSVGFGASPVIGVTFSADSHILAAIGEDQSISVVGTDGKRRWSSLSPAPGLSALAVSNNGEHAAATDGSGTVHLLNKDGDHQRLASSPGARTAFSPDSDTLVVAGATGGITLWSTRTGQLVNTLDTGDTPIFDVAFSPDGDTVAAAGDEGRVLLWNVPSSRK